MALDLASILDFSAFLQGKRKVERATGTIPGDGIKLARHPSTISRSRRCAPVRSAKSGADRGA